MRSIRRRRSTATGNGRWRSDDPAHDRRPKLPEVRTLQYYEMLGCRALYRDGMKAVTYHPIQATEPPLSDDHWSSATSIGTRPDCTTSPSRSRTCSRR
ncbi:MAG: hypothetical protein R2695_10110 [Acidimicrobiales bacterium]